MKLHPNEDYAYIKFIHWLKTVQDESFAKHFPNILLLTEHGGYTKVVMERLVHYYDVPAVEQDTLHKCLTPTDINIKEALEFTKNKFVYDMNVHRGKQWMFKPEWGKFDILPSFNDALQALLIHVWCEDYACDLHDENIMFRRDGLGGVTAVIIDPFTSAHF